MATSASNAALRAEAPADVGHCNLAWTPERGARESGEGKKPRRERDFIAV